MMYNADFLIAAVVILLLVLRNFLDQKRAEDLNSRVFLFFAVIGILDVIAELVSNYYITSGDGDFGLAAVVTTTIFYLFQALLPYALLCYIMTLHDNKLISVKKMLLAGLATILLASIVLTNPFTEKLFYFDVSAGYVEGPWYRLDVLQRPFPSGSDFDPCYLLEKRIWPSENKGDPGYPDPVRMRGSDPAFALPSADDRFWHESWNTGSVSYYQ